MNAAIGGKLDDEIHPRPSLSGFAERRLQPPRRAQEPGVVAMAPDQLHADRQPFRALQQRQRQRRHAAEATRDC